MKVKPHTALREAQPAASQESIESLLKDLLEIGQAGDDQTQADVLARVNLLKRNSWLSNNQALQALPRGPEMFKPSVIKSIQVPGQSAPQAKAQPQPAAASTPAAGAAQPATATANAAQPTPPVTPPAGAATPTTGAATPATAPAATTTTPTAPVTPPVSPAPVVATPAATPTTTTTPTAPVTPPVSPPVAATPTPAAVRPAAAQQVRPAQQAARQPRVVEATAPPPVDPNDPNAAPATPAPAAPPAAPVAAPAPPPPAPPPAPSPPLQTPLATASQPAQAPAAPPTPATPAKATSPLVAGMMKQIGAAIQQPQVNSEQVMSFIANAVKQTQQGTPDRAEMVAMIKAMQNNAKMTAKVPQLSRIALETRLRGGNRLNEKAAVDPNATEPLDRSELDAMFLQISNKLIASGKLSDGSPADQGGGGSGTRQDREETKDPVDAFDEAMTKPLTVEMMTRAASKQTLRSQDLTTFNDMAAFLKDKMAGVPKDRSGRNTLQQLLSNMQRAGKLSDRMLTPNVKDALIAAVKNKR